MKAESFPEGGNFGGSESGGIFHADRNALGLLGLARRAGRLAAGETGTRKAVHSGEVRLILLAADASRNAEKRAEGFARAAGVPLLQLDADQAALSAAAGASGGVIFAVCDEGLALGLLKKLSRLPLAPSNEMN